MRNSKPSSIRISLTNVYMQGDYTGTISLGPKGTPLNVILDTGSSALAVDANKYTPSFGPDETQTNVAQTDSYGDGSSWTGAVVMTTVQFGSGDAVVSGRNIAAAIAYQASSDMFNGADGILGLAYQPLDNAYDMQKPTWTNQPSANEVVQGLATSVVPCLIQLAQEGVVPERVAFYTKRSFVKAGSNPLEDPQNQGWMVLGDCEAATDLYTGPFQVAAVLADDWYCTNLKSISIGTKRVPVSRRAARGMPSNSIVDSGTNSLNLGPSLLNIIRSNLPSEQANLLDASLQGKQVSINDLGEISSWPTLTFVLQGADTGPDVELKVPPQNYWQVDAPEVGMAMAAITEGQDGNAILGLPLMNGYYTIFDGTVGAKGVIKFATRT